MSELRPPTERVSPRARWFWAVRALIGWIVVVGLELVILLNTDRPGVVQKVILAASLIAAIGHLTVMPRWRYRVHRWEVTDSAVYTQTGWFTQERRIAPTSRIQTVDTHRGPIEQLFRLSNVTVTTASAAGPLRIHGLDRSTAERLAERLTSLTQGGDGT